MGGCWEAEEGRPYAKTYESNLAASLQCLGRIVPGTYPSFPPAYFPSVNVVHTTRCQVVYTTSHHAADSTFGCQLFITTSVYNQKQMTQTVPRRVEGREVSSFLA